MRQRAKLARKMNPVKLGGSVISAVSVAARVGGQYYHLARAENVAVEALGDVNASAPAENKLVSGSAARRMNPSRRCGCFAAYRVFYVKAHAKSSPSAPESRIFLSTLYFIKFRRFSQVLFCERERIILKSSVNIASEKSFTFALDLFFVMG